VPPSLLEPELLLLLFEDAKLLRTDDTCPLNEEPVLAALARALLAASLDVLAELERALLAAALEMLAELERPLVEPPPEVALTAPLVTVFEAPAEELAGVGVLNVSFERPADDDPGAFPPAASSPPLFAQFVRVIPAVVTINIETSEMRIGTPSLWALHCECTRAIESVRTKHDTAKQGRPLPAE